MTNSVTVTYNIETTTGSFISGATSNQLMLGQTLVSFPATSSLQQNFPSSNAFGCLSNDGSGNLSYTVLSSSQLYGCSSTGNLSAIALGTGLSMATATLNVTGAPPSGTAGGDLSGSYPNPVVGTNKVTYAKFQQASAGNVILANATGSAANYAELALSASQLLGRGSSGNIAAIAPDGTTCQISGTTLSVIGSPPSGSAGGDLTGTYPNPTIGTNKVTYAKFVQGAANSFVGNPTGSLANAQDITLNSTLSFTGTTLQRAALTGDVTASAGSNATTIANNAVTYAKFQQASAGNVVLANTTGSAANYAELSLSASQLVGRGSTGNVAAIALGTNLSMSGTTLNASGGGGGSQMTGTALGTTYGFQDNAKHNTFIGPNGLGYFYTVTGSFNVGMGEASLAALTSGFNNVAIGWNALTTETTGRDNIAIGFNALPNFTGNTYCTTLGGGTLASSSNAVSQVTAIGYNSLPQCSSNQNTALGVNSGLALSTGTQCLFLGMSATTSAPTANNQIAIGYGASCSAANQVAFPSGSDTIKIGTLASSTGTAVVQTAGGLLQLLTSSKRFKENIEPMQIDSSKIYDLQPMEFTLKDTNEKSFGFIAEDVFPLIPEIVNLDKDGQPFSINYAHFSVLLIEELRKIRNEINQMRK